MTEPTTTPAEGFKTPAMIARLEEFAREFDVPMPPLAYEDGHLLLDDPLHDWHVEHDAPLDWTLRGDVRTLLRVYRRHYEEARPVKATIGALAPDEQRVFLAGLEAYAEGVPFDDALAGIRQVIERRRAG